MEMIEVIEKAVDAEVEKRAREVIHGDLLEALGVDWSSDGLWQEQLRQLVGKIDARFGKENTEALSVYLLATLVDLGRLNVSWTGDGADHALEGKGGLSGDAIYAEGCSVTFDDAKWGEIALHIGAAR